MMDDIVIAVDKLLKVCSPLEVEIEARIRKQLINRYTAKQLIEYTNVQWDAVDYFEKKKISKHNRKCTYRQRNKDTICKSSIAKADINDLWCTVHVSIETSVPHMLSILNPVDAIYVIRYRAIIDSHYVDVVYSEDDIRVEVETCNSQEFKPSVMLEVVRYVCAVLQMPPVYLGTPVTKDTFVSYYDYKTIMHITGTLFGPFCIDKKRYQKPSTMTINVLFKIADTIDNWIVTPKVDGVRRFIICVNKGVYSIGTMKDVVYEGISDIDDITIVDCEYANGTYYIFDIPVYKGEYCGNLYFDERLNIMEEVDSMLSQPKSTLSCITQVKVYERFNTFDKLCNLYNMFTDKYAMDGLIFANTKFGYMQKVAKWKMNTTVDLEIGEQNTLLTCEGFHVDIECAGLENEYEQSTEDQNSSQHNPKYLWIVGNIGTVWEFAYNGGVLVAKRQRYDKPQANSKHIVLKNIYNSIPGTLFTGSGFYLMRKYHNMLKKQLIASANDSKAVIMDIGTGQGGDVKKWSRASKVFCIEPDEHAISEMKERWRDKILQNIVIINSRLSNIDVDVIDTKIDIFTAFFCMNQWTNDDWEMLEKVIKKKGSKKCRLLAIAMSDPREHKSENLEIKMMGVDKYNIKIQGTRIMDINERAVSAAYITKVANKCGMKLVKQEKMNYDFMTKDERRLSAMYTLFVYHKL
jgi:hypothetical protein